MSNQESTPSQAPEQKNEAAPEQKKEAPKQQGNRPDYLLEQYASVEEQAKAVKAARQELSKIQNEYSNAKKEIDKLSAYAEVEKKYKAFLGAPENYPIDELSKKYPALEMQDQSVKNLLEWAKTHNFSTEYLDGQLALMNDALAPYKYNLSKDISEDTPELKQRYDRVTNWIKSSLPEAEANNLLKVMHRHSAGEALNVLDHLRIKNLTRNNVPNMYQAEGGMPVDTVASVQERIKAAIKDGSYSRPGVRQEFLRKLQELAG